MAMAAVISFEETRQAFAKPRARQELHAYLDDWLDRVEAHMPEAIPSLEELTQAVFALRPELTGKITEALVAQRHVDSYADLERKAAAAVADNELRRFGGDDDLRIHGGRRGFGADVEEHRHLLPGAGPRAGEREVMEELRVLFLLGLVDAEREGALGDVTIRSRQRLEGFEQRRQASGVALHEHFAQLLETVGHPSSLHCHIGNAAWRAGRGRAAARGSRA